MTDNFCIVPWIHLNTEPDGRVKPCCAYFPNVSNNEWPQLQEMPLEDIWNCDNQKQLRKQFLNNERPGGCSTCFLREDSGGHSMRQGMNEKFEKYIDQVKIDTRDDGHYDNFNLIYWDFRFSNICNFKCRMCGHSLSSSWYDDLHDKTNRVKFLDSKYYGQDLMKYVDDFIDNVEEIYFAGGEPLLMVEHYEIIDKLLEKKRFDVHLRYNTNLSTLKYKNYDLIDIWKKFKKVEIYASIDGTKKNAEYTRSGTDWQKIDQNLQYLASVTNNFPNVNLIITSTVHILNVFQFTTVIDKILDLNLHPGRIIVNNLLYPEYLKVALLPDKLKKKLEGTLEVHLETITDRNYRKIISQFYNSIIHYSQHTVEEKDIRQFLTTTLRLDKIRKESIHDACPELSDWVNELCLKYSYPQNN